MKLGTHTQPAVETSINLELTGSRKVCNALYELVSVS